MNDISRGNITVVDDDEQVLNVTSLLLTDAGYAVTAYTNASEALEHLRSESADVVLSDIVMPGMNGIELLEQVKTIDPDLPVLLMTAYTDIENAVAAIKKDAFDFVLKPYATEQLLHSINRAFRFRRLLRTEKDYQRILEEFNQELETLAAERTMSVMALMLADKIRNPASVIGLTSRKLLQRPDVPDGFRAGLQTVLDEALKLDRLVQDFQCILKDKQSKFSYQDINDVVTQLLGILEPELNEKNISLSVALSEQPIRINMQRDLFRMALINVLRNAVEATPRDGSISVTSDASADHATLVIRDSGPGIPQDIIDKIFDPFFSTKEHRFGMGLPLAKQIFAEHLGDISVRSLNGSGTSFTISFPLRWSEACRLS